MYRGALTGGLSAVGRVAARWSSAAGRACVPVHHAQSGLTTTAPSAALLRERWAQQHLDRSQNKRKRKATRTQEQMEKVAEHKAAMWDYKLMLTAFRKEVQQETKERRQAEAVSAALERRRIAKRQAAARAERKRKAAISIAINEKRKQKLKENYEAGFRECARIFFEREERKKNIHGILLEELEAESKHWINFAADINAKITDDIWETPGNNSAGGQITMPDEHLWRFSADIGLNNQEEEPSERNPYLRSRMYARMKDMGMAGTYLRERRTRWDNDTRGLLKEADRLLRKKRPAPPGYMARRSGSANRWNSFHEQANE